MGNRDLVGVRIDAIRCDEVRAHPAISRVGGLGHPHQQVAEDGDAALRKLQLQVEWICLAQFQFGRAKSRIMHVKRHQSGAQMLLTIVSCKPG